MAKTFQLPAAVAATVPKATPSVAVNSAPVNLPVTVPQTLFFQRVTVPAGKKYPFVVSGNYVYVEGLAFNTPGDNYYNPTIKADTSQNTIPLTESYREIAFDTPFNLLEVDNLQGNHDLILSVWIGYGKVRRDGNRKYSSQGGVVANAYTYSVGQVIGGELIFGAAVSRFTQVSTLKKALLNKTNPALANASFRLWLFDSSFTWNDKDTFVYPPSGAAAQYQATAVIDFGLCITGSTGSTAAFCMIDGIDAQLRGYPVDPNGNPDGSLYGVLECLAPYTAINSEHLDVKLFLES